MYVLFVTHSFDWTFTVHLLSLTLSSLKVVLNAALHISWQQHWHVIRCQSSQGGEGEDNPLPVRGQAALHGHLSEQSHQSSSPHEANLWAHGSLSGGWTALPGAALSVLQLLAWTHSAGRNSNLNTGRTRLSTSLGADSWNESIKNLKSLYSFYLFWFLCLEKKLSLNLLLLPFFWMNCNHFLATVLSQVAIREFVPLTGIILFQKMCWHTLKWQTFKKCWRTVDQFDKNVVDHDVDHDVFDFRTDGV